MGRPVPAEESTYATVIAERSYADPFTGDHVSNGVITPLDQEMRRFYIRNSDGAMEVRLTDDARLRKYNR